MRNNIVFIIISIILGICFFSSLGILWPLADMDLNCSSKEIRGKTDTFLKEKGFNLNDYQAVSYLEVNESALDYLERYSDLKDVQKWIKSGLPLVYYNIIYKKQGEPRYYFLVFHPEKGILSWKRSFEEDDSGKRLKVADARKLIQKKLTSEFNFSKYVEKGVNSRDLPERRDHVFIYEKIIQEKPEIKIRAVISVRGDILAGVSRSFVIPASEKRLARKKSAPVEFLFAGGVGLMSIGAVIALIIFIIHLQNKNIQLFKVGMLILVIYSISFFNNFLQVSRIFRNWDPLWVQWMASFRYLLYRSLGELWFMVVLFIFIAAGDALDRKTLLKKGESLWNSLKGKIISLDVGKSSAWGFLTGCICGGVMTLSVIILKKYCGSYTSVQPRGFFFYAINSAMPSLSTILFFLKIALIEELGYRYFGGLFLYDLCKKKWVAILVPAVIYGLGHTAFTFLPPAEPFWARALVMTLVGCVWGWAFFKFDALTVIFSHLTADLFIFNWPRLASGDSYLVALAVFTVSIPLIPFVLSLFFGKLRNSKTIVV